MWRSLKHFFRLDTSLLYLILVMLSLVLVLSLCGYDPGFGPRTSLGRLYSNKLTTGGLIALIVFGLAQLHYAKADKRHTFSLVFSGVLWGIGIASGLAFDAGVFMMLVLAANDLYRKNAGVSPKAVLGKSP